MEKGMDKRNVYCQPHCAVNHIYYNKPGMISDAEEALSHFPKH
jgi:hypothetical protein